jgi:hypothetical protein
VSAESERPRPAYGEYATPEQVARARGMSLEEYERHLASVTGPSIDEAADVASASPSSAHGGAGPRMSSEGPTLGGTPASGSATTAQQAGRGNRFATTALLAFGLACTLLSVPGLLSLGDGLAGAFAAQGLGEFTSFDAARAIGSAAIVVQLLLWLLALALSLAALRRGRVSWWIPLVVGAVAVLLVSALWLVAIFVDPAFMEYINEVSVQA